MNEQEKTLRTLRKMAALGQPRGLGPLSFLIAMQNNDDIIRGMGFDPKDYNLGRGVLLTPDHFRMQAVGPQSKVIATNIKGVGVRVGDVVEVLTDNGMASACYSGQLVSIELGAGNLTGHIGVEASHGIDYIPLDVIDRLRVVPQPSAAQPVSLNPKVGDGMILDTPCGLVLEARVISPAKACAFEVEIEAHTTTTRSKIPIAAAVGMRFSVSIHDQPTAELPGECNIGPARLTLYDPQGQTTVHYNAPFVRLTMIGASGVPMRNQQRVAQGGFNGTPLDPATASTDSVAGLAPCDYCNGLGRYDPFVGPTADCPKCSGTGNETP